MRKCSYISLFIMALFLVSSFSVITITNKTESFKLETTTKIFIAGDSVELIFTAEGENSPSLFISNSYGSTLINPKKNNNKLSFTIPPTFSKKSGIIDWILVADGKNLLKNSIEIIPNVETKTLLESYFGPISIQAGNRDYSMLVVIPTDKLDNPLPKNTSVNINQQFLENISTTEEKTKDLIVWHNIMAKEKTGTITVSSSCNNINSTELSTIIYPSNPTDFEIKYSRNHHFADGNQLTKLTTSKIADEFGNTISDGTIVEFIITTTKNTILKTRGTTINGTAQAKILHPDYKEIWTVKGYVTGLASSNDLTISFEPISANFNVSFSDNNRKITVGPIQSFINQLIPDGALIKLNIFYNNNLIEIKTTTSFKGFGSFDISSEFYKEKSYSFIVEVLGNSKIIETTYYVKKDK